MNTFFKESRSSCLTRMINYKENAPTLGITALCLIISTQSVIADQDTRPLPSQIPEWYAQRPNLPAPQIIMDPAFSLVNTTINKKMQKVIKDQSEAILELSSELTALVNRVETLESKLENSNE